ncbi:MAG TPA: EamA family transporter [Gammaproteobacteria bacterium]|jgi:drug/metabolite transporter (DMT)-like permease|nr:EamA family transporter [Gammaproteobacteria bacterium]
MTGEARQRLQLIAAFAIVYIVWGSTYLAIRIGVADLPPALLAGARNTSAGTALMLFAWWRTGMAPWRSPDWKIAVPVGLAMIAVANGFTTWGEDWVPSNQAALISVCSALFTAWFGTFGMRGHALSLRAKTGLGIGFVGAVLLFVPGHALSFEHLGAQLLILISTMSWAAGAMWGRHKDPQTPPLMLASMQMLTGGVVLLVFGFATGEASQWQWTFKGVGAVVYLAVFGSCLSYTTYIWLVRRVTPDKLSTIAYVNPLVAVILGWLVLDETLNGWQVAGMFVLLFGVLLINTRAGSFARKLLVRI